MQPPSITTSTPTPVNNNKKQSNVKSSNKTVERYPSELISSTNERIPDITVSNSSNYATYCGCILIGEGILFDFAKNLEHNRHDIELCKLKYHAAELHRDLGKIPNNKLGENVILYLGDTDVMSNRFCSIKFRKDYENILLQLFKLGVKKIIICKILPRLGLENNKSYYRNLSTLNTNIFYAGSEFQHTYCLDLFYRFTCRVNTNADSKPFKYLDDDNNLKYQPRSTLYQILSGSGAVQRYSLNDQGLRLLSKSFNSYIDAHKSRKIQTIRNTLKLDKYSIQELPERKQSSISLPPIKPRQSNDDDSKPNKSGAATLNQVVGKPVGTIQDFLAEGEENELVKYHDVPVIVPLEIAGLKVNALVDEGAPHILVDYDFFEKLKAKEPEIRRMEFSTTGSIKYQNAIGKKTTKAMRSLALQYEFDNCLLKGLFHSPAVIIKGLNQGILLGRQWKKQFEAETKCGDYSITLTNPETKEKATFRYGEYVDTLPEKINRDFTVSKMSADYKMNPMVYKICAIGSIDLYNKKHREKLIEQAKIDITKTIRSQDHLDDPTKHRLEKIILSHPETFRDEIGTCTKYVHEFDIEGVDKLRCKNRPIPHEIAEGVRPVLDKWKNQTIVLPSDTPYRSPLQPVKKKNGTYRPCGNYKKLNGFMKMKNNEVPRMMDMRVQFHNKRVFSKLDIREAFLQILLGMKSRKYTGFMFEGVCYEFTRVPFGTKDSMPALIKALQIVLGDLDFVTFYVDDILIHSIDVEEHLRHLQIVLDRLSEAGFTLNVEKCEWAKSSVEFVGMIVSGDGTAPKEDKVESIRNYPVPKTKKEVQSFLGVVGFYRNYIPNFADIAEPLHKLTHEDAKYEWTEIHQNAFKLLIESLAEATLQAHPDFEKPFYIRCDASSKGVAGAIYQFDDDGNVRPVSFCSRLLQPAERNYTVTEQEMLAIIYTLKTHYFFLMGNKIQLYTDHQALTFIKHHPFLSPRLTRWLLYLANFDIDIQYIPGKSNEVADALSRFHQKLIKDTTLIINYFNVEETEYYQNRIRNLYSEQLKDQLVRKFHSNPKLVPLMSVDKNGYYCWKGHKGNTKLYVPIQLRKMIIRRYHSYFAHPGINKLIALIRSEYNWPNLAEGVYTYTKNCLECNVAKKRRIMLKGPLEPIISNKPNELICVDYHGPMPRARGGVNMILVCVDHFTKYTRMYPVRNANTKNTISAVEKFITEIGPVESILSDNGPQFSSNLWRTHWKQRNISTKFTAHYTPQSNPAECVMRTLGDVLRIYTSEQHTKWLQQLPVIEHRINNIPHSSTNSIPYELMFGKSSDRPDPENIERPPISAESIARETLLREADRRKNKFDSSNTITVLKAGEMVMVKRHTLSSKVDKKSAKQNEAYMGPYEVVRQKDPNYYLLLNPENYSTILKNIRELSRVS